MAEDTRLRGFAAMDADKRRELQSRGGSAKRLRPFEDRELARKAGRVGGINKHKTKVRITNVDIKESDYE